MNTRKCECCDYDLYYNRYGEATYKRWKCECQDQGYGIDLKTGKCENCGKQLITKEQAKRRRESLKQEVEKWRDY